MAKHWSGSIFTPFRALGYCSNHVPLCIRHHVKYNETYVITCVGKQFHSYNTSKLGIISVSNQHEEPIRCLAANATLVFSASGNVITAFSRGRLVSHVYEGHENNVHLLLPFGQHLISVDESSLLKVWDIQTEEVYLEVTFDHSTFAVTSFVHPSTYVNKILLGSKQGELQLWNVRTAKLVHTFYGWGHAVTALEQAPAVDVIAVGLSSGDIYLHNIKFDELVVNFRQDWGPVTTVSFRTDGVPVMTTGSPLGHIAIWDLEKRRLASQMRDSHDGPVTGMKCLPSQPLMVTSSSDNSVKVWMFDQLDGSGRLLRDRSGHSAPLTKMQFHSPSSILSAGLDSTLRLFSTQHERHNKSFGRASYNKSETKRSGLKHDQHMMPPIISFTSESSRSSDWDSIVACHRGERMVTTWNYDKHTMGKHKLHHPRFSTAEKEHRLTYAQSCIITSCGNYCILGYTSGHVDMYNLQSGIHRGTFGDPTAHSGSVRGVNVDGLNQCVVTSGADALVKFWRFKQKTQLAAVEMNAPVADTKMHRESCLLAVVLDDFTVCLLDVDTRTLVRRFSGHENRVTDVTFSTDGRWLVTSSMDCTIRTWDIPTGGLVDAFLVGIACTSLCLSPNGEYLATTHVDDVGVCLWSNQALYHHLDLRPLPKDYQPRLVDIPTSRRFVGTDETEDLTSDAENENDVVEFMSPEQISEQLVTLSTLPNSRWQNLLNLDVIKQRNKPKEAPKAPKNAPFFLPTIPGLTPRFEPLPADDGKTTTENKTMPSRLLTLTRFGSHLDAAESSDDYVAILERLKELGPSGIDSELRSLSPDQGGSIHVMIQFLNFIHYVLSTNKDFQLAQAYLGLFIKIHGEEISQAPEMYELLTSLHAEQARAWSHLQQKMNQSLCLVNYLKSATV